MTLHEDSKYSLITLILPEDSGRKVLPSLMDGKVRNIMQMGARGSLLREGSGLQKLFPPPAPKQQVYQALVPNDESETFMREIVQKANITYSGAGAVFSMPCPHIWHSENFSLWPRVSTGRTTVPFASFDGKNREEKERLHSIFCIVERNSANPIARSAIENGAPGPTILFAEGRGLRDKVRLLRITKSAEKEIIMLVVEECDRDHVFTEMARDGKLTEPGRGFIYSIPVENGTIRIPGVESQTQHSASIPQIITAIDELKGGKEWRGYNPLERDESRRDPFANNYLKDLVNLTCIVPRDHAEPIQDAALKAGAPAASTSYGRLRDGQQEKRDQEEGIHIQREWGFIQCILSPSIVDNVRSAMQETAEQRDFDEICFYSLAVPKALTYLGR